MTPEQLEIVADAANSPWLLSLWEQKFVEDLKARPSRELSEKQRKALVKIARKIAWY